MHGFKTKKLDGLFGNKTERLVATLHIFQSKTFDEILKQIVKIDDIVSKHFTAIFLFVTAQTKLN